MIYTSVVDQRTGHGACRIQHDATDAFGLNVVAATATDLLFISRRNGSSFTISEAVYTRLSADAPSILEELESAGGRTKSHMSAHTRIIIEPVSGNQWQVRLRTVGRGIILTSLEFRILTSNTAHVVAQARRALAQDSPADELPDRNPRRSRH